jgi:hypothetical protein
MGMPSIFSYSPIKVGDIDWYILVKMSTQEAFKPVQTLLWHIIMWGMLILFLSACVAWGIAYLTTKPLTGVVQKKDGSMETIASTVENILAVTKQMAQNTGHNTTYADGTQKTDASLAEIVEQLTTIIKELRK